MPEKQRETVGLYTVALLRLLKKRDTLSLERVQQEIGEILQEKGCDSREPEQEQQNT